VNVIHREVLIFITVYLRAVKELILEGEMKNCKFLQNPILNLGSLANYFMVYLGEDNTTLAAVKKSMSNIVWILSVCKNLSNLLIFFIT